jgi:hypothetical protein
MDRLQLQRFELKYLVSEPVALAARDFVSSYLVLDENSVGRPNNSYPNHSLYLDSSELQMYWDVINGNRNRYKLRVRFYNEDPGSPLFLEIKQRHNDAILKQRSAIRREALAEVLDGATPSAEHLFAPSPKQLSALQRFTDLMLMQRATPQTHVSYLREAWMTENDNSARVTFDREVRVERRTIPDVSCRELSPVMPWRDLVILELKFTGRFPNWFGELIRLFGIMQCGVAKYAEGVTTLGESRFPSVWSRADQVEQAERFINARAAQRTQLESREVAT